jgi:hypothetical protein
MFHDKNTSVQLSKSEVQEIEQFYLMLQKMELRRPQFSAKRLVKKLYPNYFKHKSK